jgi:transposase
LLAASSKSSFQRLQCLWLRGKQDLSTEASAQAVGFSLSHVRRVWSAFLRGGLAAAQGRPKGGRCHQNLTVEEEGAVLAPLAQRAQTGQLITVRTVKTCYQARVRRPVPDSTVCRLLARHQWRPVQARPKHPQGQPHARAAF